MGALTPAETAEVEQLLVTHPELKAEVEAFRLSLDHLDASLATPPPVTVKPLVFATIDYFERAAQGKISTHPIPQLSEQTRAEDFAHWLNDPAYGIPADFNEYHAIILGLTPTQTTALAWVQSGAPMESHEDYIEKFYVLEGTCELVIDNVSHSLKAGDFISVPLFQKHYLQVTSQNPCKLILQRTAA